MRRAVVIAAFLLVACARLPPETKIPELRETMVSAVMLTNMASATLEADAPVTSPQDAWVGFRKLFPDEAKDCDGWAQLNDSYVFSIRPPEKNQEAGFKDIVYVKRGTAKFRRFSAWQLLQ